MKYIIRSEGKIVKEFYSNKILNEEEVLRNFHLWYTLEVINVK